MKLLYFPETHETRVEYGVEELPIATDIAVNFCRHNPADELAAQIAIRMQIDLLELRQCTFIHPPDKWQ